MPLPGSPIEYAPAVGVNLFSYGGEFFVFSNGGSYVGAGHNGPWAQLPPQYVPRPILAVPVRYYHERPREWAHWRHEAPPRWSPSWGNRWEERRAAMDTPQHAYAILGLQTPADPVAVVRAGLHISRCLKRSMTWG